MLLRKTTWKGCAEPSKSIRFLKVGKAIFNISSRSGTVSSNEKKLRHPEREKTGLARFDGFLYNSNSGLIPKTLFEMKNIVMSYLRLIIPLRSEERRVGKE